MLYQVLQNVKLVNLKSPKVPSFFSDNEVVGKIAVRKGGEKIK
jgi:hypothetical protein